jgi:hypothetical protein
MGEALDFLTESKQEGAVQKIDLAPIDLSERYRSR